VKKDEKLALEIQQELAPSLLSPALFAAIFAPSKPRPSWMGPRHVDLMAACTDPTLQKDRDSIHQEF